LPSYAASHGRILVPQNKNASPQTSSSSPLTSGQNLSHKHTISHVIENAIGSTSDILASGSAIFIGSANNPTRTIDIQSNNPASNDIEIGYVQLAACVADHHLLQHISLLLLVKCYLLQPVHVLLMENGKQLKKVF